MKKGFTLIELLAVIVILAIIALIATPIVMNVIENAKKGAAKRSVDNYIDAVETKVMEARLNNKDLQGDYNVQEGGNLCLVGKTCTAEEEIKIDMNGNKPSGSNVFIRDGKVAVALVYNETCYTKHFNSNDILENDDIENCSVIYTESLLNGAVPELDSAMIPVVFDSEGKIEKANLKDEWYKYEDKKWANAVLVSDDTREEYKNADAGTTIAATAVKAYYVWIPRYKYQIFTDVSNLERIGNIESSANYNNKAKTINVEFEDNNTKKSTGTTKGSWLTHPAFTFGEEELNGIWVGKYETTGTADAPTVLAYDSRYDETNETNSLRNQSVSEQFETSKNIKYGLKNLEARMLKNMEWGAIAYLTASNYGQGTTEVMINNSSNYNTGCAATVAPTTTYGGYKNQTDHTEGYYAGCENEWYTPTGQKASTTGNMYGIYDMSGGAEEYVMGVIENNDNSYITKLISLSLDSKYYNLYTNKTDVNNDYSGGHLGDATYELDGFSSWAYSIDGWTRNHSGWNKDYAHFATDLNPCFSRGGGWDHGTSAGVFAFLSWCCNPIDYVSFRSVLRKK